MLQTVVLDRRVFALEKAHAIEQVLAGKLTQLFALVVVPGVDEHVVSPFAQSHQRPGPRHLLKFAGITGPGQCSADNIRGQATIDERGIRKRWPGISNQAQLFCCHPLSQQQQSSQGKGSMQSRHARKSLAGGQPFLFSAKTPRLVLQTLAHGSHCTALHCRLHKDDKAARIE
ncbi:hypothetical protein D3C81_1607780 [compost metagenome]